jgi:hypothetical protein
MFWTASTRAIGIAAVLCGASVSFAFAQGRRQPAPIIRSAPQSSQQPHQGGINPKQTGQHLSDWMSAHSNLTPQQQQEALEKEPGFRDLPPKTQQNLRDQLSRLNELPPQKRQHRIETNEWMEHLTVEQRSQVRSATQQLASLPPDERRYVARTFRGLRQIAPGQREKVLNSDRFSHLTPAQRSTLDNLMKVEPLIPPAYDSGIDDQPTR